MSTNDEQLKAERAAFEAWWKTSEFYNLVHFEGHFRRSADAAWQARAALEQKP